MSENSIHLSNKNFKYVLAVAEEKTVQAAADRLFISQPSLSRFIKDLEARIGIPLFERIGNRLILTPAGKEYVEVAKKISLLEDSIEKRLLQLQNEGKKHLYLGVPDHWAPYYVPPLMAVAHEQCPDIRLEILDVRASALEPLLLKSEADLIIYRKPSNQEFITHLFLREDPLYLAIPKSAISCIKTKGTNKRGIPFIDLSELKTLKYIFPAPKTSSLRMQVDLLFDDLRMTPEITFCSRSVPAAMRMVSDTFGCCFVSETHRRYHAMADPPYFLAIDHPAAMLSLHLSYMRDRRLPKYILDFIELIKSNL